MTRARVWPLLLSLIAALALSVVPMPAPWDAGRPDFVALTVTYWALFRPQRIGVGAAWLAGLPLDVLKGSLLGQHALALAVMTFVTSRFHLRIRVFPVWQQAVVVLSLAGLYQFILFWIDGVADASVPPHMHWVPVLIDGLIWPPVAAILHGIDRRLEAR